MPDLNQQIPVGYVRLEEAVKITGLSEKTVRVRADQKQIGKRKWKGLALYRRSDLEALASDDAEVRIVKNPSGPPMVAQLGQVIAAGIAEQIPPLVAQVGGAVASAITGQFHHAALQLPASSSVMVPVDHKRYLTLEESIAYTGLGEFYITENCESWPIGPHGKRVFRRADLDKL